MQELKVEIQIRLEILRTGLLEPEFPEAGDGTQVRLLVERAQNGDVAADERLRVARNHVARGRNAFAVRAEPACDRYPFARLSPGSTSWPIEHATCRSVSLSSAWRSKAFGRPGTSRRAAVKRNQHARSSAPHSRGLGIYLSEDAIEKIWQKSVDLLGALKSSAMPRKTKPGTLEEWRHRQREELISTLMQVQGDVILAELGRCPNADGQWSEDDVAALYAECDQSVKID